MGFTVEERFEKLIDATDDLLRVFLSSKESGSYDEMDRLFNEREILLHQLFQDLTKEEQVERYQLIYETWRMKESHLQQVVQSSLSELECKLGEARQKRSRSSQYDSYLQQMPYGAFFDQKK